MCYCNKSIDKKGKRDCKVTFLQNAEVVQKTLSQRYQKYDIVGNLK